ncbi:TIR-like domain protein [Halocaridina rubra]|uniref:TIR-like domain protein n=1 Tax=Halocaridina rubra TaxID=373956 RepID=A0AAN8XDI9_HALRR
MTENPRLTGSDMPNTFSLENVNFTHMTNLELMTLDEVPLLEIKSQYFNALINLKELSMNGCFIHNIEPFSFQNLSMLEKLFLRENLLTLLHNNTFFGLSNLKQLDLADNRIAFFSHDIVTPKVKTPSSVELRSSKLQDFDVKDHMYNSQYVSNIVARNFLSHLQHVTGTKQLIGTTTGSTGDDDFGQYPRINTPFIGLKNLEFLDLTRNQIKRLFPEVFEDLIGVEELIMADNQIKEWLLPVFQNCRSLTSLALEKNSMTYLTDAMVVDFSLDSVENVNLLSNEFICNCSLLKFNDSLDTSIFLSYPSYVCIDGNTVYNLSYYIEMANCPPPPDPKEERDDSGANIKLILSISIVAAVVLALVSMAVYKKRWYIRYITYSMRKAMPLYQDGDKYVYDTFVCYSQTDRQWVFEHLLPKLEDVERLRVCVHERDFTVGQEITDNIINCIEQSRKVIVVLTPSFVASSWCMFELQMASNKILDERKCKLILVLLDSIPLKMQPKKLKLLLKTRTYIAWEKHEDQQKLFWARILRAVSKPTDISSIPSVSSTVSSDLSSSDDLISKIEVNENVD